MHRTVERLNFKGKLGGERGSYSLKIETNEHRNAHLHTAPVFTANPYSKFKRILIGLFTPVFACCVDTIRSTRVVQNRYLNHSTSLEKSLHYFIGSKVF